MQVGVEAQLKHDYDWRHSRMETFRELVKSMRAERSRGSGRMVDVPGLRRMKEVANLTDEQVDRVCLEQATRWTEAGINQVNESIDRRKMRAGEAL